MYKMLRKERVMRQEDINSFLLEKKIGRLGMSQHGEPYVIPIGYIYDPKTEVIYFHCAKKGRKIDAITSNPKVCFEIDDIERLVASDMPCKYDIVYRSVIAFGTAFFLEDPSQKVEILRKIFDKFAGEAPKAPIAEAAVKGTQIIGMKIDCKTGKENPGGIVPDPPA